MANRETKVSWINHWWLLRENKVTRIISVLQYTQSLHFTVRPYLCLLFGNIFLSTGNILDTNIITGDSSDEEHDKNAENIQIKLTTW